MNTIEGEKDAGTVTHNQPAESSGPDWSGKLAEWERTLTAFRLPRWETLPDLELYMDQVIVYLEKQFVLYKGNYSGTVISPSIINNYVKLGVMPRAVKKKYSRTHLAYLLMICLLKPVLAIADIGSLLANGLKEQELPELFDRFCAAQEQAYREQAEQSADERTRLLRENGQSVTALEQLALLPALRAGAGKLAAESIIALEREMAEAAAAAELAARGSREKK